MSWVGPGCCGLDGEGGPGVDGFLDGFWFGDVSAGEFDGLGAGLRGFPAFPEPGGELGFVGRRAIGGRTEGFGRGLAFGQVGVEGGFVREAVGEVAEGEHAGVLERMLGCGFRGVLLGAEGVSVVVLDVGLDGVGGGEVLVLDVGCGEPESGDVGAGFGGGDFALGEGGEDASEGDLDGGKVFEEWDFNAVRGRWWGWFFRPFGHAVGRAVMEVEETVVLFPDAVGSALDAVGAKMSTLGWHLLAPFLLGRRFVWTQVPTAGSRGTRGFSASLVFCMWLILDDLRGY